MLTNKEFQPKQTICDPHGWTTEGLTWAVVGMGFRVLWGVYVFCFLLLVCCPVVWGPRSPVLAASVLMLLLGSPPEAWLCLWGPFRVGICTAHPPNFPSFPSIHSSLHQLQNPTTLLYLSTSCLLGGLAYANAGKTTPNLSEPSRTLQSVIYCVFGDPGTSLTVFVGLLKVLVDGWNKSKNNKRGVNTGLLWTSWDTPKQQVLKHMLKTINRVSIQVSYGPPETPQTNKNK